jgi:hypothetical protein
MGKANLPYRLGFNAGVKSEVDRVRSDYDKWHRAAEAAGLSGREFDITNLAVRQIVFGTETGNPDAAKKKSA